LETAMTEINEKLLDERLGELEAARAWSPRLISKLENDIRMADDAALFRINPLGFAVERKLSETEVVDLFLHASAVGLFNMNWIILCPLCSCVINSFRALGNLNGNCRCTMCHVDFVAELDDMIAVTFTVSPTIRRITYHDPEFLPVGDYNYRYRSTMEGLIPDGTPFTVLKERGTKALAYLEPESTTSIQVAAGDGLLVGYSPDGDVSFLFAVNNSLPSADGVVSIVCDGEGCDPADGTVPPGTVTFQISNTSSKRLAFGIIILPEGWERPTLHFAPFLSGKRLLTTQTFRDLFRSEVTSEGLGVKDITVLFTDLKGSTALYDQIGDLNAFALVEQHFERLHDVVVRNDGAIIKTIGDAVMAAFRNPEHAVRAALEMREEIAADNRGSEERELILKIGMHKGAAIVVTLNERLDYFGQTVNIAARVQNLADADEIVLTMDVYEIAAVRQLLEPFKVETEKARLKGLQEEIAVYRVTQISA
jgi:class 3 adenylate cyclase